MLVNDVDGTKDTASCANNAKMDEIMMFRSTLILVIVNSNASSFDLVMRVHFLRCVMRDAFSIELMT